MRDNNINKCNEKDYLGKILEQIATIEIMILIACKILKDISLKLNFS